MLPGPHVDLAGGGAWRTMPSDAVGEAWASRRRDRRGIRAWDQVATLFCLNVSLEKKIVNYLLCMLVRKTKDVSSIPPRKRPHLTSPWALPRLSLLEKPIRCGLFLRPVPFPFWGRPKQPLNCLDIPYRILHSSRNFLHFHLEQDTR